MARRLLFLLAKANRHHDPKTGRFARAPTITATTPPLHEQARVLRGAPVAHVRMGVIQATLGEKASDAALRWLVEHPQDGLRRDGLGLVTFDAASIKSTLGHGFSGPKLNALAAVPEVVRHGIEMDASMDWEGRPLLNRILAAPIEIDGRRYIMFVRLRKDVADTQVPAHFYVHEAILESHVANEEASPFKTGSDPDKFRGKKSGGTGFYVSLARRALKVNEPEGGLHKNMPPGRPMPMPLLFVRPGRTVVNHP